MPTKPSKISPSIKSNNNYSTTPGSREAANCDLGARDEENSSMTKSSLSLKSKSKKSTTREIGGSGSGDPTAAEMIRNQPLEEEEDEEEEEVEENPFMVGYPVLRGPLKYVLLVLTIVIALLVPRLANLSKGPFNYYGSEYYPTLFNSYWHEQVQGPVIQVFTSTYGYLADKEGAAANSRSRRSLRKKSRTSNPGGICQKYSDKLSHKAVIFDAGSTGSRVHVYAFRCDYPTTDDYFGGSVDKSAGRMIFLDGERFEHIQPGLSNYANNATAAAESLRPLLEAALEEIPGDEERQSTPIMLRATAGLRLLPDRAADEIIEQVNQLLSATPFRSSLVVSQTQPDGGSGDQINEPPIPPASIMSGLDEGIYAWFTINFLTGKLHSPSAAGVTLDLGGGSTQITFTPQDPETIATSPPGTLGKRLIDGELENMYSHSYLGYGLMSARKTILAADPTSHILPQSESSTLNPLLSWFWAKDNPTTHDHIIIDRHPCFSNSRPKNWTYDGILYVINDEQQIYSTALPPQDSAVPPAPQTPDNTAESSAESSGANALGPQELSAEEMEADFQRCVSLAQDFVSKAEIHAPAELAARDIYALSYFYDRSLDAGIISEAAGEQSHSVTVMELYAAAQAACTRSWPVTDRIKSFLCLDLSYIYAYLHDGLRLDLDKEITLAKKINGIETSWALGAALELLQHL